MLSELDRARNRSLHLPETYIRQPEPSAFDDRAFADEWQREVYEIAWRLASEEGLRRIVDFGCGGGFKLMKHFKDFETIGYEIEPALSFLKEKYPDRDWRDGNPIVPAIFEADMVICSDVIEHLEAPEELLISMAAGGARKILLSTPALELLSDAGVSPRSGPPSNLSHVYEWTTRGFAAFVSQYLEVVHHSVTNVAQCTQLLIARPR